MCCLYVSKFAQAYLFTVIKMCCLYVSKFAQGYLFTVIKMCCLYALYMYQKLH